MPSVVKNDVHLASFYFSIISYKVRIVA